MPATTTPRHKRRTAREKLEIIESTRTWTLERAATTYRVSQPTIRSWRAHEATFRKQVSMHAEATNG
jgi:hypothetical protein